MLLRAATRFRYATILITPRYATPYAGAFEARWRCVEGKMAPLCCALRYCYFASALMLPRDRPPLHRRRRR